MKENLPYSFKDKAFISGLDESSKRWLQTLFKSLNMNRDDQYENYVNEPYVNNFLIKNNYGHFVHPFIEKKWMNYHFVLIELI